MTATYTIDDNGDTLLILRDPNRPFEAVDQEDLWYHHLQLYDDVNNYKSHLLDNKRDYHFREQSINYPPLQNPDKEVAWRVSSEKLKSASVYFRNLAAKDWENGKMSEQVYKYTITVKGWNERALHKLMLRIHGEYACLRELQGDLRLCAQLAVLVDAYQCHILFQLRFPVVRGRYPYSENLLFSFYSSWVFRDKANFKLFSKAIIMQTRGRMHTLGMPIPESVINAIEQRRQSYIAEMVNFAHDKVQKLLGCDPALTPGQEAGEDLEESLHVTFASWPPEEPFDGLSAANVYRALRDIRGLDDLKIDDFCHQSDSSSEMDTSMTDSGLYSATLDQLREDWEGLDMEDFRTDI